MEPLKLCLIFIVMPVAKGGVPGSFFWKPRLGINLSKSTPAQTDPVIQMPTDENVRDGLVVMIDAFQFGSSVLGLADGLTDVDTFPYLNPTRGYFYTNAYRWALRHISLIPSWAGHNAGSYYETQKVWKKRFFYADSFLPKWLEMFILPGMRKDWANERREFRRFKKFAESSFIKYCKRPSNQFNNFISQETKSEVSKQSDSSSEFDSKSQSV